MTDDSPLTNRARSESSGDLHLVTPADGSPRSGWTSNRLARAGAAVCAVVLVVGGALVVRDLGDGDSTESPGAAASSAASAVNSPAPGSAPGFRTRRPAVAGARGSIRLDGFADRRRDERRGARRRENDPTR